MTVKLTTILLFVFIYPWSLWLTAHMYYLDMWMLNYWKGQLFKFKVLKFYLNAFIWVLHWTLWFAERVLLQLFLGCLCYRSNKRKNLIYTRIWHRQLFSNLKILVSAIWQVNHFSLLEMIASLGQGWGCCSSTWSKYCICLHCIWLEYSQGT